MKELIVYNLASKAIESELNLFQGAILILSACNYLEYPFNEDDIKNKLFIPVKKSDLVELCNKGYIKAYSNGYYLNTPKSRYIHLQMRVKIDYFTELLKKSEFSAKKYFTPN